MLQLLALEKAEEEVDGLAGREDAELVGVLDVHDLVADVVRRLDQVDERVAGEAAVEVGDAQLVGDAEVGGLFALEEAELAAAAGQRGGVGILDDRGERAVCERESALSTAHETVGE